MILIYYLTIPCDLMSLKRNRVSGNKKDFRGSNSCVLRYCLLLSPVMKQISTRQRGMLPDTRYYRFWHRKL